MSSYADKIAELKKREAEFANELSRLADKRKEYSLAAVGGDGRAQKQIADVDFEEQALRRDAATVSCAIETAEALERQEAQDAQAQQLSKVRDEASRTAEALIAVNVEVDAMLKLLREAFERRAELLQNLSRTGLVDGALVMRMSTKAPASAAAQFAGLGRFLALEMTPVSAQRPLVDSNSVLLGLANSAPRVRPRMATKAVS
jgi:hypothetical protein